MRKINRGAQPVAIYAYMQDRESKGLAPSWSDFATSSFYGDARQKLHGHFGGMCAYCEESIPSKNNPASIDHFRPRNPEPTDTATQESYYGRDLTFAWCNWQYACGSCQAAKSNKWPGSKSIEEDDANAWVSKRAESEGWQYTPPSLKEGYIDPTDSSINPRDLFTFDVDEDCRIIPRDDLDDQSKSAAWRTIYDLGLNSGFVRFGRRKQFAIVYHRANRAPKSRRRSLVRPYCNAKDFKYDPDGPRDIQFISFMEFAEKWLVCDLFDECMPKTLEDACEQFKFTPELRGNRGRASGARSRGPRARRDP